jgi:hypothetical protein
LIRVEITKSGLAAIGKNGYRESGRSAILAAAEHWWRVFLPLHFENVAYRRYRYKFRDDRTDELKVNRQEWPFGENTDKAIGEDKPLVFTGRSREVATRNRNIRVAAPNFQTYRADVVLNARAFNFGSGKRIDMRDEVTRFTPQEERTMERIFAEDWENQLIRRGQRSPKKTKRIAA